MANNPTNTTTLSGLLRELIAHADRQTPEEKEKVRRALLNFANRKTKQGVWVSGWKCENLQGENMEKS